MLSGQSVRLREVPLWSRPTWRWRWRLGAVLSGLVGSNLPVDHRQVGLKLVEPCQHPAPVSPQQVQPSRTLGVARPDQVDEVAYVLHRHARTPQPQHHIEQAQGVSVEDSTPAAVTVDRAEQPGPVVVAESVDRQARESRHVTDHQVGIVVAGQLRKYRRCAHMNSLQPGAHSRSTPTLHNCQDAEMEIRDVVDSDWAAVWGFMLPILAE